MQTIYLETSALTLSGPCKFPIKVPVNVTNLTAASFSARLPDRCAAINRKLGGPVVSPPKPRLSKSTSLSGAPSRPGAATKRPVPAKPRRTLKRVLTDDREHRSMCAGPNRAISLMRSATMPAVPGLKREISEAPSLSSIPAAGSQLFTANRREIMKSKRLVRREVDLNNLVPGPDAKAMKQAKIDAELKDAIAALKKPNRELAAKTLAETAEKRSVSASHPRSKFSSTFHNYGAYMFQNSRNLLGIHCSKECRSQLLQRPAARKTCLPNLNLQVYQEWRRKWTSMQSLRQVFLGSRSQRSGRRNRYCKRTRCFRQFRQLQLERLQLASHRH